MNKLVHAIMILCVVPLAAHAMSQDEQGSYKDIKIKYEKLDQELNELYKSQISEYKKEGGEFYGQDESKDIFLKKSQLSWIKVRDADCAYETYESQKGTGFQSIYLQCLYDKTNDRIKYLKENN
jgi:uncharacterized protein YecT (DUF1311 family)